MKSTSKEIIDALNAFLVIDEILASHGVLDTCQNDQERMERLSVASKTLNAIAIIKGITVGELQQRVINTIAKLN